MPTPKPPTAHTAKIAIGWQYLGQQLETIFCVEDPTDSIFSDPETFLNAIKPFVISDLIPHMFSNLTFNMLGFEDIRTVPFGGTSIGISPPVAGGLTSSGNLPGNVCLAIKKNTGGLGRSHRGRTYWPITDIAALATGDTVQSAYAAAVQGALLSFQADVEGIVVGSAFGIVSYFLNKVLRTNGLFQRVTEWSLTDMVIDSQRRRLPGRGR